MKKALDKYMIYIIPVLIFGIYFGFASFPFCLTLILLRICFTDRDTLGVYFLMFGGNLGGMIRTMYPLIPIYGILLNLVGIYFLSFNIRQYHYFSSFKYILLLFMVFLAAYILGPQSEYANKKIVSILMNGTFLVLAYRCVITSKSFCCDRMVQLLLLTSILAIVFITRNYGFTGPHSLFDYSWFRSESMLYDRMNEDNKIMIGYQQIGMDALVACAYFFSKKKQNFSEMIVIFLICFHVIMTSGARQAIMGLAVVVLFKVLFFSNLKREAKVWVLPITGVFFVGMTVILSQSEVESISGMFVKDVNIIEVSGRANTFLSAETCIRSTPVLGAGLGGFELYSLTDLYPHNIILEILCECGIIGLSLITIILGLFLYKNKPGLKYGTQSELYFILPVIALLCRFMVSSDLGSGIGVFSAILCMQKRNVNIKTKAVI